MGSHLVCTLALFAKVVYKDNTASSDQQGQPFLKTCLSFSEKSAIIEIGVTGLNSLEF